MKLKQKWFNTPPINMNFGPIVGMICPIKGDVQNTTNGCTEKINPQVEVDIPCNTATWWKKGAITLFMARKLKEV